jgi:zinc finger CCHC domain-containing protein 9
MTRFTNFGRKRTYVEAGFKNDHDQNTVGELPSVEDIGIASTADVPSKKRRKNAKKSKAQGEIVSSGSPNGGAVGGDDQTRDTDSSLDVNTLNLTNGKPSQRKDRKSKGTT